MSLAQNRDCQFMAAKDHGRKFQGRLVTSFGRIVHLDGTELLLFQLLHSRSAVVKIYGLPLQL